jgi:hypothetical protein
MNARIAASSVQMVRVQKDCGGEVSAREFRLDKNPERLSEKARQIPP